MAFTIDSCVRIGKVCECILENHARKGSRSLAVESLITLECKKKLPILQTYRTWSLKVLKSLIPTKVPTKEEKILWWNTRRHLQRCFLFLDKVFTKHKWTQQFLKETVKSRQKNVCRLNSSFTVVSQQETRDRSSKLRCEQNKRYFVLRSLEKNIRHMCLLYYTSYCTTCTVLVVK